MEQGLHAGASLPVQRGPSSATPSPDIAQAGALSAPTPASATGDICGEHGAPAASSSSSGSSRIHVQVNMALGATPSASLDGYTKRPSASPSSASLCAPLGNYARGLPSSSSSPTPSSIRSADGLARERLERKWRLCSWRNCLRMCIVRPVPHEFHVCESHSIELGDNNTSSLTPRLRSIVGDDPALLVDLISHKVTSARELAYDWDADALLTWQCAEDITAVQDAALRLVQLSEEMMVFSPAREAAKERLHSCCRTCTWVRCLRSCIGPPVPHEFHVCESHSLELGDNNTSSLTPRLRSIVDDDPALLVELIRHKVTSARQLAYDWDVDALLTWQHAQEIIALKDIALLFVQLTEDVMANNQCGHGLAALPAPGTEPDLADRPPKRSRVAVDVSPTSSSET